MSSKLLSSIKRNIFLLLLVFLLLPLLTASILSALSVIKIERVSVSIDGGDPNGDSYFPSISLDGRYVTFSSYASDLVSGDDNGEGDVFVYDRQTGFTERVSVDINGGDPNDESAAPSISADGQYVAFYSYASDLVNGDTNGVSDVFVYDRQTGFTERVSVSIDGGDLNGDSYFPSISADGRYVAFYSYASDLVDGDGNGASDIFVYDRQTGFTERVSNGSDPYGGSLDPSISADGRYIAFESNTSNLVNGDNNNVRDVFVYDRQTGFTERVSVDINGGDPNNTSFNPSISEDGRYVVFESNASNLVSGDNNNVIDVFVYDRQTGFTERVSVDINDGDPNNNSGAPSISANGRYVVFDSRASDLVIGDGSDGWPEIFVYDLQTGLTERVSVNINEGDTVGGSNNPSINADGRYVAFFSNNSNLVSGDSNGLLDIFVAELDLSDTPSDPEIVINTPTFQHKSLPEDYFVWIDNLPEWVDLPKRVNIYGQPAQPTTYDGNIVQIQTVIENTGTQARDFKIYVKETETGNIIVTPQDKPDTTSVTIAAGAQYSFSKYWDTIGYAWDNDKSVNSLRNIQIIVEENDTVIAKSTPTPVWISPRPVILVHGWGSSADNAWLSKDYPGHFTNIQFDWRAFAVDTLSTGGPSGAFKEPSINGWNLFYYIEDIRRDLNAHHVDIIGHSYGGIVSRYYIDTIMQVGYLPITPYKDEKPIAINLVMLGTPNLGTRCASRLVPFGAYFFTPKHMAEFNEAVKETNGVYFSNLAGTGWAQLCAWNGDGIVPPNSAQAFANQTRNYPSAHHWQCGLSNNCLLDSNGFDSYVKSWLSLSTSQYYARQVTSATLDVPRVDPIDTSVMTDYQSLVVSAGTTETVTIPVNGASSLVYSGSNPPGVAHTLFDPSNAVVETITEDYMFPMISVDSPINGIYTVKITNNGSQPTEIKYNVWQSDISVQVSLDVDQSSLSGQVPINLTVTTANSADTISNVSGDIMDDDNNVVATVPLTFDGTKYTGFTPPLTTGLYGVFAHVTVNGVEFHQIDVAIVGDIYGDADTSLISNGGFEGSKTAGVPVGWSSSRTTDFKKDKQKCNKPDKTFSHSGDCAFLFKGNPSGSLTKIKQNISDASTFTDGSNVEFSVYVDKRSANVGHAIGKVVIKYDNNTKDKLVLKVPSSDGYTLVSDSVLLDLTGRNISKVKVQFRNRLKTGKFFIDDASLTIIPPTSTAIKRSSDTVPLPDVPADFRD